MCVIKRSGLITKKKHEKVDLRRNSVKEVSSKWKVGVEGG